MFCFALAALAVLQNSQPPKDLDTLVRDSKAAQSLHEPGGKPFQRVYRGEFYGIGASGEHHQEFTLMETWISSDKWRTDFKSLGYTEVEWGVPEKQTYRFATLYQRPIRVQQLFNLIDNVGRWPVKGTLKKRKLEGEEFECVGEIDKSCFATSGLASVMIRKGDKEAISRITRFQSFGLKQVPESFIVTENKQKAMSGELERIGDTFDQMNDASFFEPSPKARKMPHCEGTWHHPDVIKQPDPEYTDAARKKGLQADILVQGTVTISGDFVNIALLQTGEELDEPTVKTLSGWKFKPATCDGAPIESDISVEVSFRLR
jgi:hypothetical protein